MNKTNVKITRYESNDLWVDVIETEDNFEAWTTLKDYGVSNLLFGMPKYQPVNEDVDYDSFVEIVAANLDYEPIKNATDMEDWESEIEKARTVKFGSMQNWLDEIGKRNGHRYSSFTENLIRHGFCGFSDVDVALQEIAQKTGYDYNYLCEVFDEGIKDGEDVIELIASISETAMQYDLG